MVAGGRLERKGLDCSAVREVSTEPVVRFPSIDVHAVIKEGVEGGFRSAIPEHEGVCIYIDTTVPTGVIRSCPSK